MANKANMAASAMPKPLRSPSTVWLLLLLLALQRIGQARKLPQQSGKVVRFQLRQDFIGDGPLSVHLRGHADGAIPVHPADGCETTAQLRIGDHRKGNLSALRGPDPHPFHLPQGTAPVRGIPDHDLDLVPAPLNPLDLFSIESLPDLSCQVRLRQAQRLGGRMNLELDFLLAGPERIGDVVDPGVFVQFQLELARGLLQMVQVGAGELDVDGSPRVEDRGRVAEFHGIRDGPRQFPPAVAHLRAADEPSVWCPGPFFGRRQFDVHLSQVGTGKPGCVSTLPILKDAGRLFPHGSQHMAEDAGRAVSLAGRVEFLPEQRSGPLHPCHRTGRDLGRSALRHGQEGHDVVRLYRREEIELDSSAQNQADDQHQGGNAQGRRQVAPLDGHAQEGFVDSLDESFELARDQVLEAVPQPGQSPFPQPLGASQVGEVMGQDEQGLDQ